MPRSDDDFADLPPRRPSSAGGRSSGGAKRRPSGRQKKQGTSGWLTFGIVAGVTVPLLVCCGLLGTALMLPAVQQARLAAQRTQSKNNLKEIGLAAFEYQTASGAYPPFTGDKVNYGRRDDPGNPRMSWMTTLLPYMGQQALWSRVDPAVAFDDPAAAGLYGTRVSEFLNPAVGDPGTGLGPAHYAGNVKLLGPRLGFSDAAITDGASSTLLGGEIDPVNDTPAPWGDPDNLRDPAAGLNVPGGFGSPLKNAGPNGAGAQMLFADATVRFLSEDIDPEVLAALATPDGGEPIGAF
ncbi:MAG: DUF1559 domain-containing protein [Planctomycetota bacterium]